MDIFFSDPDDIPLAPKDVRIKEVAAKPWPDGKRVAVRFHITAFQQRPNIELKIFNSKGEEVAELSVVEVLEPRMEFTMHLRENHPVGDYTIQMRILYSNLDDYNDKEGEDNSAGDILKETSIIADRAETTFKLEIDND